VRRLRTIFLFVPAIISVGLWVSSYSWFTGAVCAFDAQRSWYALSDTGGVYVGPISSTVLFGQTRGWYWILSATNDSAPNERLSGMTVQRWKPVRIIQTTETTLIVVPWWLITLACGVPPLWAWRRRRRQRVAGFEVEFVSKPSDAPPAVADCQTSPAPPSSRA
jgi:hypothetical protein